MEITATLHRVTATTASFHGGESVDVPKTPTHYNPDPGVKTVPGVSVVVSHETWEQAGKPNSVVVTL